MTTSTPEIATFLTYPFRMSSANGFPDQDSVNAKLSALPRTASSSTSRRPLRMRMACTNCHSAKVKCSGERSGCTRCRDNGLTCDYEISMVGRMSIKRGKRRRHEKPAEKAQQQQQEKTQHQQQQHDQRSERASTHSSSTTNEPSPQRELPPYEHRQSRLGVEHMTPQDLPSHGSAEMVDLNGPSLGHDEHSSHDLLPDSITSAIDQGNFDEFSMFDHPGLDSNMGTMRESPSLTGPPATVTFPQTSMACDDSFSYDHDTMLHLGETLPHAFPTPPDLLQQGFDTGLQTPSSGVPCNYSDLGAPTRASVSGSLSYGENTDVGVEQPPQTPLSSLMKIIHDLELGVRSTGPVRIDSRLIMNRKAMAGLRVAIGKESFRTCNSCIVLVASALDLILENYGYIIDAINSEEGPNVNDAIDGEWDFTNLIALPTANTMIDDLPSHEKTQCPRKTGSGDCSYASTMQLRIGCYELSGEDQVTLRNHIIGKELRRCIEIARICVTFSQSNSGRGFANNNRVRASLQADTEASAYRLIASLESRGEEYMFIKP